MAGRVRRETGRRYEVKVLFGEGVANHTDPESCAATREGRSEALTGDSVSQPLSGENQLRGADAFRRLVSLLRRADERVGDHGVPAPSGRSLAPRHQAAGTEASARMAANEGNPQSLPVVSAHPASVAGTTVSRQ